MLADPSVIIFRITCSGRSGKFVHFWELRWVLSDCVAEFKSFMPKEREVYLLVYIVRLKVQLFRGRTARTEGNHSRSSLVITWGSSSQSVIPKQLHHLTNCLNCNFLGSTHNQKLGVCGPAMSL